MALEKLSGVDSVKVDCVKKKAWISMKAGQSLDEAAVNKVLSGTRYSLASFQEPKPKAAKTVNYWKMTYTRGGG